MEVGECDALSQEIRLACASGDVRGRERHILEIIIGCKALEKREIGNMIGSACE